MSEPTRERLRACICSQGDEAMLIYSPPFETARRRFTVRFILVPLLALTGARMWSLRALRDLARHRRNFDDNRLVP